MTKRQKFLFTSLLLFVGLVAAQLFGGNTVSYPAVILLSLVAYFLSAWCLREDLHGVEWGTLLLLPALFTGAVALSYYLVPVRWATRLTVAGLYGFGIYALLLTENIFNVAASHTIGLLRPARVIHLVVTLVTFFLLTNTISSFHPDFWQNFLIIGILAYSLMWPSIWSIKFTQEIDRSTLIKSGIVSLVIAETALIASFIKQEGIIIALFLTTIFYVLHGLALADEDERLFPRTLREYLLAALAGAVLLLVL